jgi:hypothetical protein
MLVELPKFLVFNPGTNSFGNNSVFTFYLLLFTLYRFLYSLFEFWLWGEFCTAFHPHHLSAGPLHKKQKEFLDLEQGNHSVFD